MFIKIPKYTWINIVDGQGKLLRQECTQEDIFTETMEPHKKEISVCENLGPLGTMAAQNMSQRP